MAAMDAERQTPQQRLERIEQSIERWRRKPASRRQRLILAGYRRAASELRRQVAALVDHPTPCEVLTPGIAGRPPETCTPLTPYRVFRVIRNPAPDRHAGDRHATRAVLRVV